MKLKDKNNKEFKHLKSKVQNHHKYKQIDYTNPLNNKAIYNKIS